MKLIKQIGFLWVFAGQIIHSGQRFSGRSRGDWRGSLWFQGESASLIATFDLLQQVGYTVICLQDEVSHSAICSASEVVRVYIQNIGSQSD
jgi:hypothetical protein